MSNKSFRNWVDEDYNEGYEDSSSDYRREDRKRYNKERRKVQNARKRRTNEKNSFFDDDE